METQLNKLGENAPWPYPSAEAFTGSDVEFKFAKIPSRTAVLSRLFNKDLEMLQVCLDNPRNEIDNPIRYCTLGFQISANSFVTSTAIVTLPRAFQEKTTYWVFERLFLADISRIGIAANTSPGAWEWRQFNESRDPHYFVSAYLKNRISAELALRLSGLTEMEFAEMIQEKAMKRDLPIFQEYLKGEDVNDRLPFSNEETLKFKDLMAHELE